MAKSFYSRTDGKPKDWFPKVGIVRSDVKREYFPTEEAYISEKECILRSEQVADVLEGKFHIRTEIMIADERLGEKLLKIKPDFCINFVDSIRGSGSLAAGIPGIFELHQVPYMGSNTLSLSLTYNKFLTKTLLRNMGIPTPRYQLFRNYHQPVDYDLHFPLILKLNEEHGSVGMDASSVVTSERELRSKLKELFDLYDMPVVAEEFIEGATEVTGFIYESTQMRTHLNRTLFDKPRGQEFKLITFTTKWAEDLGKKPQVTYTPFRTDSTGLIPDIKEDLRRAFKTLKMDDYARFDILLDKYDNYYFVDCNANPEFGPESHINGYKFENVMYDLLRHNHKELKSEVYNFAASHTS